MTDAEVINLDEMDPKEAVQLCLKEINGLVEQVNQALGIIERQHKLLVKHGINPKEGELVLPEGRVLRA